MLSDSELSPLVEAIHERHGTAVKALDMSSFPLLVDAFVIASSDNRIQSRAIADRVIDRAEQAGMRLDHREGYEEGSWILLDFSGVVVHIFLSDRREYYNLEMLWNDAPGREYPDAGSAGE
ncbi:ribosome silencing factor [Candidatus Fermentibacterales bacterium]|nr:ribosome silencing factor [Candidatus Fermentibacterales bacterium]